MGNGLFPWGWLVAAALLPVGAGAGGPVPSPSPQPSIAPPPSPSPTPGPANSPSLAPAPVPSPADSAKPGEYTHWPNEDRTADSGFTGATQPWSEVRLLILLVNFSNVPPDKEPGLAARLDSVVFRGPDSIASSLKRMSYGKVRLTGEVKGWYELPRRADGSCASAWLDEAQATAEKHGVNVKSFTHVIVKYPADSVGKTCDLQATDTSSGSLKRAKVLGSFAILHELLHLLGPGDLTLPHGRGLLCGEVALKPRYLANCAVNEYGDPFDSLGHGQRQVDDERSTGDSSLNAPHRIAAGWLAPDRITTVKASGTYTIKPLDSASGTVALKIKKPDRDPHGEFTKDDSYYVEFNPIPYAPGKSVPGVTVRIWDGHLTRPPYFLDLTPGSCRPDPRNPQGCSLPMDAQDGFLEDGKSFADGNGTTVTQVSHGAEGAVVKVQVGSPGD